MQVRFARELARIVKSGVRVIIATHSELMLETIANIVTLSAVADTERTAREDVSLEPNQVGA